MGAALTKALAVAIIIVAALGFILWKKSQFDFGRISDRATSTVPTVASSSPLIRTIGTSVQGRPLSVYTVGTGTTTILFVGGIHGGYEWNSVLLAYRFIDYLAATPGAVPASLRIIVVPNANPDGVFTIVKREGRFGLADVPPGDTAAGRLNAHGVDLNRNFACKWQATATWKGNPVSGGTGAFSEPESQAIRDLALTEKPVLAVFWHSAAGQVYASECERGILPETLAATRAYAAAAGYPPVERFDAYQVTGDAEGWLASQGIPAITVELSTHETIEWEKNLAGIKALLQRYGSSTPGAV